MPLHHPRMTTSPTAEILLIEGPDAVAFAQSQFSNNVSALPNGRWQFSAWLDAQGRVRALFHLAKLSDTRLLLLLRGGNASAMTDALRRFVFRARVTFDTPSPQWLDSGPALPMHDVVIDGEITRLGCGDNSLQLCSAPVHQQSEWALQDVRNGWPWLPSSALDRWLPPALSLYRLSAVALDKGCYPGQEIVARLHYRGGHKWHMHGVSLSRAQTDGATLHANGQVLTHLLQVVPHAHGIDALAMLHDDTVERMAQGIDTKVDEDVQLQLHAHWPA